MKEEIKKAVEEIMNQINCPKNFFCVKNEFNNLCKAKDLGLTKYLKCLEGSDNNYGFTLAFGFKHYCMCQMRIYIARNLGK